MLPDPDALIFDFDGTLVISADLHFAAMAAAVVRQGGTMSRPWYDVRTGLGRRDLFAAFALDCGHPVDVERLVRDSIVEAEARAHMARPNPPVVDLARRFQGRRPLAVATNGEAQVVKRIVLATGMEGLFDAIVSVDDVKAPKPAPDIFLAAAMQLGVSPENCLVLEDSVQGLAAAKAAGMAAIDVRGKDALSDLGALSPR